jgi:hypothetical protein
VRVAEPLPPSPPAAAAGALVATALHSGVIGSAELAELR